MPVIVSPYRFAVAGLNIPNPSAFWRMEEASGNRVDTVASLALTDNNTVGQDTTGFIGNSAAFIRANSESLTCANTAAVAAAGTGGFTIAGWFKPTSVTAGSTIYAIASKYSNDVFTGYRLEVRPDNDQFWFRASDTTNTLFSAVGPWNGVNISKTAGKWYLIFGWYEAADGKVYAQLYSSNEAGVTPAASTALTGGLGTTTHGFAAGRLSDPSPSNYMDGSIDCLSVWQSTLTQAQRDAFWNSGAGAQFIGGVWS